MRVWPSSLRGRLTIWYTLVLGAPLIALTLISYLVFARTLLSRTDSFINDALTAFARELTAERRFAPSTREAMRTTVDEVRFRELGIVILDDSLHTIVAGAAPEERGIERGEPRLLDPELLRPVLRGHDPRQPVALTLTHLPIDYRIVARPLPFQGEEFVLVGVYALNDLDAILTRIQTTYFIAIPLLLLVAASGGYFLAHRSFAPVTAMAARAAVISATNLHERLPVASSDELGGLSRVFNDLLDRLEDAFAQQQRFMADASHELRTPTAVLRAEADVTLSRPHRSESEYRESVSIIQDAARRLTRIVDDLFLLARADAGHLVTREEELYLEESVIDAARAVRQIADQRQVTVSVTKVVPALVRGDADLLGRLLLNLLDNAIKYSPSGGTVEVRMESSGEDCRVTVSDRGPGIPLGVQPRIFERFFRADAARSRAENSGTSGAGLGLAIASRIAELHHGRLELVESRPGRTEFRFSVPVSSVAAKPGVQGAISPAAEWRPPV
ncbi:MAG: Adaptive-response sensory-kinase SasA [Gemmatimonadaceae bacterium]|nr:Adaptive-response sensory-kinase SasA [Gemmatimonadaceae bacterium]